MTLYVHEIYPTIQGESTYAGLPCVMVRLTGCPLRCSWCDTEHAFHGGTLMTISDIVEQVLNMQIPAVEITGGEPLAQKNAKALLRALAAEKQSGKLQHILLETSGAISIADIPDEVVTIMDVKCPSSGEVASNELTNLARLRLSDQLKFVVADKQDFDWMEDFLLARRSLAEHEILLSPVFSSMTSSDLANLLLHSPLTQEFARLRMQVQLHKTIWPDASRGV